MGSTTRDTTGMKTGTMKAGDMHATADTGNSSMMLRRKVRLSAKDLRQAFKDMDRTASGMLSHDDLRYALYRFDIDLNDAQFAEMMAQLDHNNDGMVSYAEFLDFFHREEEGLGLKTVTGITVDQAVDTIRAKINEKLDSRPGALNRAFQYFDADGSGAIDFEELKKALLIKCGLIYENSMLRQVMDRFDDDGSGVK